MKANQNFKSKMRGAIYPPSRIIGDLEKWDLPPPEFEEKQGWLVIRFRNPNVERVIDTVKFDLNERLEKAIEYLKEHGKITRRDYMGAAGAAKTTEIRDLNESVNKGILVVKGPKTGWGRYYTFNLKVS